MKVSDLLDKKTLTVDQLAEKHKVSTEHIQTQLKKGVEVELEHTSNPEIAKEIALDHLGEDPDYYIKLSKVEKFAESFDREFNNKFINKFLPWVQKELNINELPEIKIVDNLENSFGTYDAETKTLYLVCKDRHPVDTLRTLAHELTHYKQDLKGYLDNDAGETGSPQENEANANAGVVLRSFAFKFPDYLESNVSEDFTGKAKPGSRPGSLRRKAGLKKGETMGQADLLRLQGRANKMKKSKNKATKDRGIQLQRQVNWYKNFHKKKNEAVGLQETVGLKSRYAGKGRLLHFIGYNGNKIPSDIKALTVKHVKGDRSDPEHLYIVEYDPDWYEYTFRSSPLNIKSFADLWNLLKPYFTEYKMPKNISEWSIR